MQIETHQLERSSKAVTNFASSLPKPQSDLALESVKDPYRFDFLRLTNEAQEREIENAFVRALLDYAQSRLHNQNILVMDLLDKTP